MAKINLLPWREARRDKLKQAFFANLGASVLGAGAAIGLVYFMVGASVDNQDARNDYLQGQIDKLNNEVKEIAELKSAREQLIDRMQIIQGLQGNRPVIVRVFDQFVESLPDGVYYTKLKRSREVVEIEGTAESNNRVSSLLRRLDRSDWFHSPNLASVVANPAFGEQANNFSLKVSLTTPDQAGEEAE
ncbi:MAG: PilN domain-containing protein [Pseudomonadales bacterium]